MEKAASLKLTLLVAVLFCFVNSTKSTGVPHGNKVNAIAVITGREGGPKGSIFFFQDGDHGPTILNGYLHGLPPGHHGFHVHAAGDTRHECNSAGMTITYKMRRKDIYYPKLIYQIVVCVILPLPKSS
ncbi:hypothetical protein CUMW_222330 [Citrus unshiu]|nr:hypothetical protein CUMW_222330 [Citrus unshiu]